MDHVAAGIGAVPVPLARRDPHHVARADAARLLAGEADPAAARDHVQHLPALVAVPVRAPARREEDVVDHHAVGRRHDRVRPNSAAESLRAKLGGLAFRSRVKHLHFFPFPVEDCNRMPPDTSPMASTTRLLIWSPYPSAVPRPKQAIGPAALSEVTPSWCRQSTYKTTSLVISLPVSPPSR